MKPETSDQIMTLTNNLFRKNFGHSPQNITVFSDHRCLLIHLDNFMGADVVALVKQNDTDALRTTRELIVEYIIPDLLRTLSKELDIHLDSVYYDWEDSDLSGVITGLYTSNSYRLHEDYFPGKDGVHHNIDKITYDIQKVPDSTYSYWVNPDILVVVREGLLIKIEKELVMLGFSEVLRKSKRSLEKTSIIEQSHIPELVNRTVNGVYLDWDFVIDKSMLVYRFEALK